jgi:ATP-dependent RNA helicase DeaD
LPRDAEALQHRSGRTGRAGKKGTAVLLVPYPRRRRVDMMLKGARIEAEWSDPPSPEDIRKQDHERLLTALLSPVEFDDEDTALAERLMAEKTPHEIAAALVHAHRASMPAPEELIDRSAVSPEAQKGHRAGFEDIMWFKMDVGRRQNADARWLLPLICRRGHVTKSEIGAIRIGPNETAFQIPRAVADKFLAAVGRTAGEDEVTIIPSDGPPPAGGPREGGPQRGGPNRPTLRATGGGDGGGAKYHAKPAHPRGPRRP